MIVYVDPWILEEGIIPLEDLTLEEVLRRGETQRDRDRDLNRVSLRNYPAVLQAAIYKSKSNVQSGEPEVTRLATKLGARILQSFPEIRQLDELKTAMSPDPFSPWEWAAAFTSRRYELRGAIFLQSGARRSVPLFGWVHGLLSELASITSLPTSQMTVLAIVAGISRSRGLPEQLVRACQEEIKEFRRFLRKGFGL
tara:strand:+ start:407 stop:997 length:591 start_codon:yes stop_codon:yes gene_type:complete